MQADAGEKARAAGCAAAVELGDHALGQIVGLDLVVLGSLCNFRHAPEVGGDDAFQQAIVMQPARAEPLAVAGTRAHDQREVARGPGFDEALLKRRVQRLRDAALDKAGRRDDRVIADERDGFISRNDLVGNHCVAFPQVTASDSLGLRLAPAKPVLLFVLCRTPDYAPGWYSRIA